VGGEWSYCWHVWCVFVCCLCELVSVGVGKCFFLCMHEYFWLATSTSGNLCQATSTSGKFYVGIVQRVVLLAIAVRQLVLLASN
jgi:hypothetical protein